MQAIAIDGMFIVRTVSKKREEPGVLEGLVNKGVISESSGRSKKRWRWVFLGMGRARGSCAVSFFPGT